MLEVHYFFDKRINVECLLLDCFKVDMFKYVTCLSEIAVTLKYKMKELELFYFIILCQIKGCYVSLQEKIYVVLLCNK